MKTRKLLKSTAEELIKVMTLTDKDAEGNSVPIVIEDSMDEKAIEDFIKDAVSKIEPGDVFSKETIEVIKEYGGDTSIVEEEKPTSIEEDISNAETLKELKSIALAEPEFKVLRGKLGSFKTVDALREEMTWLFSNTKVPMKEQKLPLEEKEETQEDVAERLHEKLEKEPVRTSDDNYPDDTELLGLGTMKTKDIVTIKPFNGLFKIDEKVFQAVKENMEINGFDHAFPIVVWGDVVLDGHTRLEAAEVLGIEEVPILRKEFKDEKEALEYSIHNQRDRRNLSDAELLRCIEAVDAPMTKAEAGKKGGSKSEVKTASVKSHKETAKKLGVGETKVTDARTVLADEGAKEEVLAGKKTISKAAKEIREKKEVEKPKKETPEKKKLPKNKKEFKLFILDFLDETIYIFDNEEMNLIIDKLLEKYEG